MMEWLQANAVLAGAIVAVLVLALVFLLRGRKTAAPKREYRDVLSDGAAPAARNSALIDAPPAAAIVPPPVMAEAPPPASDGDDLTRIKGLGPKISAALRALGVTRFSEIAAWTDEDVARIDAQLGAFAGRATRDNWIEQAKLLSSGDTAAYEAKFGKL
ncbi:hypothetical protein AQZ52_06480 [Novosphingobium fuchskuhlense]|uniref:LSU ribosomal protein L21p n=1 Tax=Novosphingobium fuchskuhlense TaxID=1117702 RepID=A0A117UXU4_9SPHN|nr:hypothetical protein [Novosphingobium fuchskuhlense]KUR72851.1 hypothetical protein AQZ52_06480 [Novosphingobium fuchskuhlense]